MYSLVLLAALLYGLERDRRGDRRWLVVWLPLFVALGEPARRISERCRGVLPALARAVGCAVRRTAIYSSPASR
jgi:hypothetical protein